LDRAYVDFSSEAAALETEIRAWYRRGRTLPDEHEDQRLQQDGRNQFQAGATAIASAIDPPTGTDELWHQIVDLLTVYYFALCGNFRVDVLAKNSPHHGQPHANIAFEELVDKDKMESKSEIIPDAVEVRNVIKKIRKAFSVAMTDVARSALEEQLTDLTPSVVPDHEPSRQAFRNRGVSSQ
jgi:hypothetical protein